MLPRCGRYGRWVRQPGLRTADERERPRHRQPELPAERDEHVLLQARLRRRARGGAALEPAVGEDRPQKYAGDSVPSDNWPGLAPGRFGPINAISALYQRPTIDAFLAADPKPYILWIRGEFDEIVSDASFFEVGTLGKAGFMPGWPGDDVFPSQPMVGQTRAPLELYGDHREVVMADTGHSPYIEKPQEFLDAWLPTLEG